MVECILWKHFVVKLRDTNENHVQAGRALGELGHPDSSTVNLDRVSHKIVSLKESGSNFIGKAKIWEHPWARLLLH